MSEVADTMFGEVKWTLFNGEWGIVVMSTIGVVVLSGLLFSPDIRMIKSPSNYEMLGNRMPFEELLSPEASLTRQLYSIYTGELDTTFMKPEWRTLKPTECTRDHTGYCVPNFYVK